jgi:hypothetical protein
VSVHVLAAILTILFLWSSAASLHAQAPERRPSSALFGAPDPRQSPGERPDEGFSVAGSLFGGYDDSLFTGQGPGTPFQSHSRSRDSYAGFSGRLLYDHQPADRLSLRASVSSAGRYYPVLERLVAGRQSADLSSSSVMEPWQGARLRTGGMARYSRYGGPFAGATFLTDGYPLDLIDGDDAFRLRRSDSLHGQVQLEQDWGRRKSVAVLAGVQSSGLEGSARSRGYELGGTLSTKLARYGTLQTGYTRQELNHGGASYVVHHVNIGGNYARPVSASRRAFVTFGGGSAVLESKGEIRMQAIADAGLRYELGRSWSGNARYHRGFMFVDEIIEPLLSDGVVAELTGLLSRRLELLGSGSFTHGGVGLSRTATPYTMYLARTQVRYALSRVTAVYAEYLLFNYRFAESVRVGASLPSYFDRQTVRAGVTVMTPLLR